MGPKTGPMGNIQSPGSYGKPMDREGMEQRMRVQTSRYLVAAMVAFTGCLTPQATRKQKAVPEEGTEGSTTAIIEERPAGSIQYTFLDTINRGNELFLSDEDFDRSDRHNTIENSSAGEVTRYRIQVFASNRIETVREQKKKLEALIKEQVLIGYEAPYYKLYAGDCSKRQEAQVILAKLKKIGYLDAWIVTNNVASEN